MWAAIKARLRRSEEASPPPPEPTREATAPSSGPAATPSSPVPAPTPTAGGGGPGSGKEDAIIFTEGFLGKRLKEGTIDDVLDDLEIVLLESDVAVPVIDRLRRDLRKDLPYLESVEKPAAARSAGPSLPVMQPVRRAPAFATQASP
jgi:hypothetical protein